MKKTLITLTASILILGMSGCCNFMPSSVASSGAIVVNQKTSAGWVDNSVKIQTTGRSKACGIILVSTGDASLTAAMADGHISRVHHIDYEITNILWLYNEIVTVAYGERMPIK